MTSSMLSGEKRRASARRGAMTVLGKVVVPKPINLPSQRLENHGLDPNVEIVPKGSLSWGSRPSSSPSNPWGSTVPSTGGDYSGGSPSHVGGRPSSGGSGTQPSTAGSDQMHEVSGAWNSNSRPSSASGALTSNQTSLTALRPQSAETRPGSSQLSRFAEHLPDNSAVWGPAGNADKLVIASTKNDKFSLSSGDFPTLGSERDNSGKNSNSQEYGSRDRPRSSSNEATANDKIATSKSDVKGGTTNTWSRDDTQHAEDGVEPNSNNWQGGYPQQFMNGNVPQHFDAWRGPPVNSPAGVWYRGPPGGPPYGPPVAAGGFPLEPFPYYRPQMPPPTLGNSQPVPQQVPVTGPRGHHPKNGDLYMPQIPDGYMHPGMPIRPGFYPRPVPYDNYYGAPMGYNPNERDMPYMGMSAAPPVFNRYPAHGPPDHSNPHARAGGHGSTAVTSNSEQMESVNSDNSRGPYNVLGKQHNGLDTQGEEGSWENNVPGNFFPEKGGQPRSAFRKNEWRADSRREDIHSRKMGYGEHSSSGKFDSREGHSLTYARVNSLDINDRVNQNWGIKPVNQNWGIKPDTASVPASPEVPHVLTAATKDSTLLQKIEGLNAKARASDGRQEAASASSGEEQKKTEEYDGISNMSKNNVGAGGVCAERPNFQNNIHSSNQSDVGTTNSRRANNGMEGRFEHRGKGRVNSNGDGWRKKPLGTESLTALSTTNVGPVSIAHNQDQHIHAEVSGMINTSLSGKTEAESLTQTLDSGDTQAQRAKMRELAKQRAIQLQKEEEERIKEQKAKALAKLEELNRRSQTGDVSTEKFEKDPPISGVILDQEESQILAEPVKIACKNDAPNLVLAPSSNILAATTGSCTSRVQESTALSKNVNIDTLEVSEQVSNAPAPQYMPVKLDTADAVDVKAVLQDNDSSSSMHKLTQNVRVENLSSESLISFGTIGFSVAVEGTAFSNNVPEIIIPSHQSTSSHNSNTVHDSSAAQRKKSTKSGKNKNKLENPLPVSDSNLQVSKQPNSESILESVKMKASEIVVSAGSDQVVKEDVERLSQQQSLISDEPHVKVNNHWKSQSRKISRNGQANKVVDRSHGNEAIMWAPVRSYHRVEAVNEAGGKSVPDSVPVTTKNDNLGQNSVKSKRAEMERYVPKQVAKELAQLGTIQQSVSSSVGQTTLNETAGRRESSFQEISHPARLVVDNVVCAVDSSTGDSKQIKQAKAAGGWKHRGSAESSRRHMDLSLNSTKNIPKHMNQQESLIPDVNQVLVEPWDPSDGWNMPEEPTPAVNVSFGMKDQAVVKGKGKRQPYKGHKNMVNKHDIDQNSNGGVMYKKQIQSTAPEINLPERNFTAEESRGSGERTSSLWQPKSQAYSTNSQTGSRSSVGQHVSEEAGSGTRKNSAPVTGDSSMTLDKGHSDFIPQLHLDQSSPSSPKNGSIGESRNAVHHDGRREKKPATAKERPQPYHKHGPGSLDELPPPEIGNTRFEQRSSSGFHKHGNQSGRSGRVQESHEEWSAVGQESRHPNVPGNRERQPRNSHFEYQPVGPHNHSKSNNFEGLADGSHNTGSRYRERGQGQPKRGGVNSYGRKSGAAVQVDAGYD